MDSGTPEPPKPLISLPPTPKLSPEGHAFILRFEVGGGKPYYDKFLAWPTWPGASSGVTIGVGYDCGYYTKSVILSDWAKLPSAQRTRLANTSGLKKDAAKALIPGLRDIVIPWPISEEVFTNVSVTKQWELCRRTFSKFDELRPNAQVALVSLVFNRGSSMTGDSRYEMRMIRDAAAKKDYNAMAEWNRKSIRVWKGKDIEKAMTTRRNAEADMMLKK